MSDLEALKLIQRAATEEWRELDLSGMNLKVLPPEIGKLKQLRRLSLGKFDPADMTEKGNKITTLPSEIALLYNLNQLSVSYNNLVEIPEVVGFIENLTYLDLSFNQIKVIPDFLSNLKNLKILILKNNKITKIPDAFENLRNLRKLDLDRNKIEEISESFLNLNRVDKFFFKDNPVVQLYKIPPEIRVTNDGNILNYLRQIYFKNYRPLHEAKMLLVGQGNVGKTSLINRLIEYRNRDCRDKKSFFENAFDNVVGNQSLHKTFNLHEPQTDGLNVSNWSIDIEGKGIRLNVWDFGGQEIYHATHQFFLTKRSLYLLVCNCRISQEENRIEYWLKLIQSFGDNSPVIIVGNKRDEQPFDINRKALCDKYSNICSIIETSCLTIHGIKELSDEIDNQISTFKEVYDLLPLPWFDVKEQLERMTEDFISYNRYIGICHENKIVEEQNQNQLIDLLHRLGLVLNFREHPLLQQTNVLKPEWATEGIYALLSDDHLKTKSKGIFCCNDITRILDAERYPQNRHQYLIELMKEFELSFALDCNPSRFLIPGILPKGEPKYTDLDGEILEFQYSYNVLPSSIISRFIVLTHEKIYNQTWWRSGVMLAYEESNEICNIARVKADPEDKKIFIAINGRPETRRIFLGLLRDIFGKLHKNFKNLEITEWVPVPDHPRHQPLDYQELLGLEAMGESHVNIGKLRLKLELRKLLDGYESHESRESRESRYLTDYKNRIGGHIDKQYNFYGDVRDPDFYGGSKMTGDQPNISINADNIGIASMSGGTIESGAIVAGQYNEGSSDLEDLLKLIALMKEAVPFFPEEEQEDLTIELDDMETEVKKPKDKRRVKKIKNCLTALATAGTVAIASLTAANEGFEQIETFVDNANTLANKFDIELAIPPVQQP